MRLLKTQESTMVEGRDGVLEAIDTLWTGKLDQRIGLAESGGWTASISVAYQHDIQRPTRLSTVQLHRLAFGPPPSHHPCKRGSILARRNLRWPTARSDIHWLWVSRLRATSADGNIT